MAYILPVMAYILLVHSTQEQQSQQEEQSPTCAICLAGFDDDEEKVFGPCGSTQHSFHPLCIDTWMRQNATCAVCRQTEREEERVRRREREEARRLAEERRLAEAIQFQRARALRLDREAQALRQREREEEASRLQRSTMPDDWTMTDDVTRALWNAILNPPAQGICVRMIVHRGAGDDGGIGSVFFDSGERATRFDYDIQPHQMHRTKLWIRKNSRGYYTLSTWNKQIFDVTERGAVFRMDPMLDFENDDGSNRNHLWVIEGGLSRSRNGDEILVRFYNLKTRSRLFTSYPALYTKYWNNDPSQGYHNGTTFKLIACREHLNQLTF